VSDASELLSWYDKTRRDLPWRGIADPYRIWLSEIMLQQTRVETVIPYFHRFLKRFPDVESLAAAELDEVLGLWSGLGYYRRARQLHAAARQIVAQGGRMPDTEDGLRELPGIGPYTAAAVASIAFGAVTPVLDGNVERVLARWLALEENPRKGSGKARLFEVAASFLVPERPGDGNQALMELGATVCTPRAPRCEECPLSDSCVALTEGQTERYPRLPERRKPQRRELVALVVRRGRSILLFRRPDDSELLAGTWELPWLKKADGKQIEERLSERYGGSWRLGDGLGKVRHSITHRALVVEVRLADLESGAELAEGAEAGWFEPTEIDRLPVSSLVGKILERAGLLL
jgi:A/G-specific adenine glycosylase